MLQMRHFASFFLRFKSGVYEHTHTHTHTHTFHATNEISGPRTDKPILLIREASPTETVYKVPMTNNFAANKLH